ncbi:MAG: T9SS type A sorting domain-containing protein [Bacteroidota bacterium]|nr:T9SS type A sorting domain-containing protein [Bacteroidota bacterium]
MRCGKQTTFFSTLVLTFLFALANTGKAQNLPIGGWRMHLPYQKCKSVTGSSASVWAATSNGLFRLNKADNSLERITKIDGLSDLTMGCIRFNPANNILFVGYTNGNIDLIQGNTIINLPDIKRAQIIGDKAIYNVYFVGGLAYVSTGFGIVVIDMDRKEVKDTYLIGTNGAYITIFDIVSDGTTIFAATESGIYYAPINDPYLSNFTSWTKFNNIPGGNSNRSFNTIEIYNGTLLANIQLINNNDTIVTFDIASSTWGYLPNFIGLDNFYDMYVQNNVLYLCGLYTIYTIDTSTFSNPDPSIFSYPYNIITSIATPAYPQQVFVDQSGILWFADPNYGLVKMISSGVGESYFPNGPISTDAYWMAESDGNLLVVPGGHDDAWNNVLNTSGISTLRQGLWTNFGDIAIPALDTIYDFMAAEIDPLDADHYWLGSWGKGLLEINNGAYVNLWDNSNSTLESKVEYQWVGVGGLKYDTLGNLWVVNSHSVKPLQVRKPNGTWQAFDFTGLIPVGTTTAELLITSSGQKWMILPRGGGMLVFDDNRTLTNTADDKKRRLGFTSGVGHIPGTEVHCMAEDDDGEIWIGTDKGIGVFYCAENIFSTAGCDAQQILITQDGYVQILLETQTVTAIAVDGANRKWIGTEGGGVFLMSADGQTELMHFTEANSPLLSDNITSITIDQASGEVFFGTSKGIVSYMGEANTGEDEMGDVYAYPNPVTHDYTGPIAITGLVKNADVKITDIRGQVVFKTTALGGRAIWDGNNFQGERAASGVYMVFISNTDGTQKAVTKILLIN